MSERVSILLGLCLRVLEREMDIHIRSVGGEAGGIK